MPDSVGRRRQQSRKRRRTKGIETGTERPQGVTVRGHMRGEGHAPPEENADLPGFILERAHMLLQEVNGDLLHHNNGSHLDGLVADNAL